MIDIIKFIWQGTCCFLGLILIFVFCVLYRKEPDDNRCNDYNRWCGDWRCVNNESEC